MRVLQIKPSITNRGQDSLNRYLHEISSYPLLGNNEEISLIHKIKNGDKSALHKLVNSNLRFVVSVAKMYQSHGVPLADLISEGNIGLLKAAERFDETRGFKFISFAVWWIRQAMIMAVATQNRMVRLPMNQVSGILELRKAQIKLEQQLERMPTEKEIAECAGIPEEKIKDYRNHATNAVSLDVNTDDGENPGLMAFIKDSMFVSPDSELEQMGLKKDIQLFMQELPQRQRQILTMSYGLDGGTPMQMEEIAIYFGLSRESIRLSKKSALIALKMAKNAKWMQQYI